MIRDILLTEKLIVNDFYKPDITAGFEFGLMI